MKMVLFIENLTIHQNPRTPISSPRQTEKTKHDVASTRWYVYVSDWPTPGTSCGTIAMFKKTAHSADTDINTYVLTNTDTNTDTSRLILIPVQGAIAMF